jgi:membrane-associated phospholipid phosphatase
MTTRFGHHIRSLWPGLSILIPVPFVAHAVWAASRGQFHWENGAVLGVVLALFCMGPRSQKLLIGAYPVGLVGILYDTMKVVENVGLSPSEVHLCDLRARELALFGVTMNGERVTLHDWFQAHSSPVLDAICAVPYGTFIFVCAACAMWFYVRDYPRMVRFSWCFFALNLAGFLTYHVYPAAAPWYYHAHGCHIDMLARASEGPNLARVDAALGIHYFAGMYGRASDVFGAMPSLHVAYALIVVVEGWAVMHKAWRGASVAFFVLMCFSAVYLGHHWVLDELAGATYCLVVVGVARLLARYRSAEGASAATPMLAASARALAAEKAPTGNGGSP